MALLSPSGGSVTSPHLTHQSTDVPYWVPWRRGLGLKEGQKDASSRHSENGTKYSLTLVPRDCGPVYAWIKLQFRAESSKHPLINSKLSKRQRNRKNSRSIRKLSDSYAWTSAQTTGLLCPAATCQRGACTLTPQNWYICLGNPGQGETWGWVLQDRVRSPELRTRENSSRVSPG